MIMLYYPTFTLAYHKFIHQPGDLETADIEVLKQRDPALADAAITAWRRSLRRKWIKENNILPVVRVDPRRR